MLVFIGRRLVVGFAVLITISILSFGFSNYAVDPAEALAGQGASAADVDAIREAYGFDRPIHERYWTWLMGALSGDLGQSYYEKRGTTEIVAERLSVTMTLGCLALLFALCLGIPAGILAALHRGTWVDNAALAIAVVGQAMPSFWFALLGIVLFSVMLGWLPASGSENWQNFILPAVSLGYYATPTIMRLTRSGMIEVLESDFVRTAHAKGLPMGKVVLRHAFPNAMLPVVSIAAVQFGFMLGGSVVIETIFAMRGVGYLAWESISRADIPVVQAIVLVMALVYIVLTALSDILIAWLDPRVRTN
jgi:peptide/nickel transport system permease protein